MRMARAFLAAAVGVLWVSGAPLHSQVRVGEGVCAGQRAVQREAWQTREPPHRQPALTDGAVVSHWPTSTLGEWVVEIVRQDDAELTRITPAHVTRVRWDRSCTSSSATRERPAVVPPRFTDSDLALLLRDTRRGVIYLWSPHMPLSIDAVSPMSDAARGLGLAVDLVLDPAADRAFAARTAGERGLPSSALRVMDSVELQFRDVLVHAPAVQVYDKGRLTGSVYPGGHTVDEYRTYLRRVLAMQP